MYDLQVVVNTGPTAVGDERMELVMKKVSWTKLFNEMTKANKETTTKFAAVIFDPKKSKWVKDATYSFEDRVYTFSSANKYFDPSKLGNGLFAKCLVGPDSYYGIKLSDYLGYWHITDCYIFDSIEEYKTFCSNPRESLAYTNYIKK